MRLSLTSVARRILVLSLILGVVLIAAPRAQADTPSIGQSGISGSVVRRTLCVEEAPCFLPARALVTAALLGTAPATFTAKTDVQGTFVLWLAPGLYRVSAASLGPSSQHSEPILVRVYPGVLTSIMIVLPLR